MNKNVPLTQRIFLFYFTILVALKQFWFSRKVEKRCSYFPWPWSSNFLFIELYKNLRYKFSFHTLGIYTPTQYDTNKLWLTVSYDWENTTWETYSVRDALLGASMNEWMSKWIDAFISQSTPFSDLFCQLRLCSRSSIVSVIEDLRSNSALLFPSWELLHKHFNPFQLQFLLL